MDIISRARWGARHEDGGGPAPLPAAEVWLHHSAGLYPDLAWLDVNGDGVEDDEARAMRTLEDVGEQRFGRGISYTWVVMPSGRVYAGHSPDRLGAHTGGRNGVARAICWAGNYMTDGATREQVVATAALLQHGVACGWWREPRLRGGHRDVLRLTGDSIATACPGDHAYAQIAEINRLAAGPPITEEDDVSVQDAITAAAGTKGNPGWWYRDRFKGDENFATVVHRIDANVAIVPQMLVLLQQKHGVTAEQVAAALLPGVAEAVRAEIEENDATDLTPETRDAIADSVVRRMGAQLVA